MKTLILSVTLFASMLTVHAQVDSGFTTLGVALSYKHYSYNAATITTSTGSMLPNSAIYAIVVPEFWVYHNTTIRLGAGVDYQKSTYYYASPSGFYGNVTYTSNGIPALIGVRRWFPLKPFGNKLIFTAGLDINFEYTSVDNSIDVEHTTTVNPQLVPGLLLMLSKHWAIQCFMGGAGYQYTVSNTGSSSNNTLGKPASNEFYTRFAPDSWLIGVNYVFNNSTK